MGHKQRGFLEVDDFSMKLPLVDENGLSKGYMYASHLKMPRNIPRVGETVVIIGGSEGLEGRVAEVTHSRFFASVTITFEPVQYSWRSKFEPSDWFKEWVWRE